MKHEIIIHAGMPKTGTSAIQLALHGADMPDCAYLNWGASPNHSPAFITAFTENAFSKSFDKGRGRAQSEIEATRQHYREELTRLLDEASARRLVFSAEAFSSVGETEALAEFRDAIAPWTKSLRVILYIRPLASALPSLFQQRCKMSRAKVSILPRVPYRANVSKLLDVFGEAVELVPYLPETFPSGDVVGDFCARIGVPMIQDAPRANTSMTAEAAALLYLHGQHKVARAPHPEAVSIQALVVRALKDIGGTKLRYTPELVGQYAQAHRSELDWISAKAGFDVGDMSGCRSDGVGRVEDLHALAISVREPLQDIILAQAAKSRSGKIDVAARLEQTDQIGSEEKRLAAMVDLLKDIAVLRIEQSGEGAHAQSDRGAVIGGMLGLARKVRRIIPALRP